MARLISPAQAEQLFARATAAKNTQIFRELPPGVRKEFVSILRTAKLPPDRADREAVLEYLPKFAEKYAQLASKTIRVCRALGLKEDNHAWKTLGLAAKGIAKLATIASLSKKPERYAKLIASQKFMHSSLEATVEAFIGRKQIKFQKVTEAKASTGARIVSLAVDPSRQAMIELIEVAGRNEIDFDSVSLIVPDRGAFIELLASRERAAYMRIMGAHAKASAMEANFSLNEFGIFVLEEEGKPVLLPFTKSFRKGNLNGFVIEDRDFFKKHALAGLAFGSTMLLESERDTLLQHELQHLFDFIFGISTSAKESEYRAKLAGIAFPNDSDNVLLYLASILSEVRFGRFVIPGLEKRQHPGHKEANIAINSEIIESQPFEKIRLHASRIANEGFRPELMHVPAGEMWKVRERAKWLLNHAYYGQVGLNYDELLKPFKKMRR